MSNYRDILKQLLFLGIAGFPMAIGGTVMLLRAYDSHSPAFGLFGCAMALLGLIILSTPLARFFAESSGGLFYPGRRFSRRQPMYSIPESKRATGLYEEAIAGFEEIAKNHPSEVKPYIDMIDISIVHLKDPDRANEIYRRGFLF